MQTIEKAGLRGPLTPQPVNSSSFAGPPHFPQKQPEGRAVSARPSGGHAFLPAFRATTTPMVPGPQWLPMVLPMGVS